MLTRLKSTLSTVTSTLQAVRELPGAMKEAIAFTRENSEVKRELKAANTELDKGLNLYLEWMNRCITLTTKLETVRAECQQKLDLQWDAVKAMEKERDAANGEWDSIAREREGLRAKLARYEAAETWLSQWRWNKVTPCPFPPDTFVQYRECEQVTPSSPNENHANEPLKEMSHTCMVSELSDSDEWRPHVECLQFYEAFKNV